MLEAVAVVDETEEFPVPVCDIHARGIVFAHGAQRDAGSVVTAHGLTCFLHDVVGSQHTCPIDIVDELGDVVVGRVSENILRGADLDDAPVAHDCDPVTEEHRLVEIVGDEDDGLLEFALQLHELLLHLASDERVEGRECLVHEQDVCFSGKCAGQADALLHAAGELLRVFVSPTVESDGLEPTVCRVIPLSLRVPRISRA